MIAQGKIPWAESTPAPAKQEPPAEQPRRSFAQQLKDAFGKLAEAVTGKPTPALFLKRRKRREESKGAFSRALILTARAVRRLFHQAANDDEEVQIETERLLRLEIDDHAREQETGDDSEAHYQPLAALDLKM